MGADTRLQIFILGKQWSLKAYNRSRLLKSTKPSATRQLPEDSMLQNQERTRDAHPDEGDGNADLNVGP